ncbi:MAG TPA: hypothetical protein DHW14_04890 [Clostridiales bacterium]|nr:hypothetical protein [Clostridiales bacterium]
MVLSASVQETIIKRGRRLDHLRLRWLLGDNVPVAQREHELRRYFHGADGWGYSPKDERGSENEVGSVGGTIHMLRFVRELEMGNSRAFRHATLSFLSGVQAPDGSLYEVERKLAASPQPWLQEDTSVDRIFFTGAVAVRLLSLGWLSNPLLRACWEYLKGLWRAWSTFDHTWYNWWVMLLLAAHYEGESSEITAACRDHCRAIMPRVDALQAAWLLDAMEGMGVHQEDPLVQAAERHLDSLREPDGMWHAGDPEVTLFAARLLGA